MCQRYGGDRLEGGDVSLFANPGTSMGWQKAHFECVYQCGRMARFPAGRDYGMVILVLEENDMKKRKEKEKKLVPMVYLRLMQH